MTTQYVRNKRAQALGLTVTVGYDFDGDCYEIRRCGQVIDTCIALDDWLIRYAARRGRCCGRPLPEGVGKYGCPNCEGDNAKR